MIRIPVPDEIRKYETKLVGPLTSRQTVCLVIAAALSGGICFLLNYFYGYEFNKSINFCIPIIVLCMAFTTKPYGLKFEDYVIAYIVDNFISPPKRKYETENYYERISKPYVEIKYDKKGNPIKTKTTKPKKKKRPTVKYKTIQ